MLSTVSTRQRGQSLGNLMGQCRLGLLFCSFMIWLKGKEFGHKAASALLILAFRPGSVSGSTSVHSQLQTSVSETLRKCQ